jgi:hypothetical protein
MTLTERAVIPITETRPGHWLRVDELADLVAIVEDGVQVCVLPGQVDQEIATYLDTPRCEGTWQGTETVRAGRRPDATFLLPGPNRDALVGHIGLLTEVLVELLDCPAVGLRFARVDGPMCPFWHTDRVGLRLLFTYCGRGTQWLDDQAIDRARLPGIREASLPLVEAQAGEIVLLKGSAWPGNETLGAVHRSPAVDPDSPARAVLTLDPLWH